MYLCSLGRGFNRSLGRGFNVVIWIREFLIDRSQRVRVGRHYSEKVRVTSVVLQGSVLGPLLFLDYVKDIWKNIESKIRLL
jgi:hypothetical protein